MIELITVTPESDGWIVTVQPNGEQLRFQSGRVAESRAQLIGSEMAAAGRHAEIQIFLRDGSLAGKFACVPEPAPA